MKYKVFFAWFAISLSLISFLIATFLSVDVWVFAIFSGGCFAFSCFALFFFKKTTQTLSKIFLGSFIAMLIVLIIHIFFFAMIFIDPSNYGEMFQFFLTIFGIIPTMIAGAILGGIFEFIERHFSAKTAYLVLALILFVSILFLIVKSQQNSLDQKVKLLHRNGQNADGTYACNTFLHEDYQLIQCYTEEAATTGSTKQCISGIERSLPGMNVCIFAAAKKLQNTTTCDYFANNPTLEKYVGYPPSYQDQDPQLPKQHRLIYVDDYKRCLSEVGGGIESKFFKRVN